MRICILSTGRAGSTSLFSAIKTHLNNDYYSVMEPFNYTMQRDGNLTPTKEFEKINKLQNSLVKTIVFQTPEEIEIDKLHDWIFNFFDKVILLDRRNDKSQCESYAYLRYTKQLDWHIEKKRYKMDKVPLDYFNEVRDWVEKYKILINELSIKYNHKIYYYEDIFIEHKKEIIDEIFESLNIIPNDNIIEKWIISNDRKVRIDDNEIKLL